MIPPTSSETGPNTSSKLLFHVILDGAAGAFSLDGPGGPNGIRLHYEMQQAARSRSKRLRDFDLWADSQEAALAEMTKRFPGYKFMGTSAELISSEALP
jgi:hypothetical protein